MSLALDGCDHFASVILTASKDTAIHKDHFVRQPPIWPNNLE